MVLLEFQSLRPRADFGEYSILDDFFDKWSLYLIRKNAGKNTHKRRNQNSKSAKIFRRKVMVLLCFSLSVMTLQHWVFQLWPSCMEVSKWSISKIEVENHKSFFGLRSLG